MIIKGDRVHLLPTSERKRTLPSFLRRDNEGWLRLPDDWYFFHDDSGEHARRCDFYIAPYRFHKDGGMNIPSKSESEFDAYYAPDAPREIGVLAMPDGPWERPISVHAIRYRRLGKHEGLYEHTFSRAVSLAVSKDPRARGARLALPDACLATWRGFITP